MQYALFIIEINGLNEDEATRALHALEKNPIASEAQALEVQRLNEGTFLVPLGRGLTYLATLAYVCHQHRLQTRTLFFDSEPTRVISEPFKTS
jgi:hypothetical protein